MSKKKKKKKKKKETAAPRHPAFVSYTDALFAFFVLLLPRPPLEPPNARHSQKRGRKKKASRNSGLPSLLKKASRRRVLVES